MRRLAFMDAWREVGNPTPGITTWSADVDGRPVFTAWCNRELAWDREKRTSVFHSPPGDWVERREGQSYLRRARSALANGWKCRVVWLEGKSPWRKVEYAYFDERFFFVRFTRVEDSGLIEGYLLPELEQDGVQRAPIGP